MDYKKVLKVASAKQEALKEVLPSPSVLLKDPGPPKKEEKSTKGINSAGVRAFLENLNKSEKDKQCNTKSKSSDVNDPTSSLFPSEDLDINHLFKKKQRVALLPDTAILDMMEISKLRKQHLKDREDARHAAIQSKEAKLKSEREKQREAERAESEKKETLKRVMNILNKDSKQSSGLKRPSSSSSSQPQEKKLKLDSKKPSNGFKIPRKNDSKINAPRPPPMKFDDLLKVAEKNHKDQPSDEKMKEILCVDLLDSKKSTKKDSEDKKERQTLQNPAGIKSKQTLTSSSSISNNKSNQLRPIPSSSNSSKINNSQQRNISSQKTGVFQKPTNVTNTNKNAPTTCRPTNSINNKVSSVGKLAHNDGMPPKWPQTSKNNDQKFTNRSVNKIPPSNGDKKSSLNDQKVMEAISKTLGGATDSMRKDLMEFLHKYQTQRPSTTTNNKSSNSPQKRPIPSKNGTSTSACNRPSSANVSRPSSSNVSRPTQNTPPTNGWDRAMSALIPKSKKSVNMQKQSDMKRRNRDDDGDDDYEEEDDDMSDFIDDTEEDLDISSHIKSIFKYDKSKYIDEDDDDLACMESKFRDIEREEMISSKIGKREDLEDMRMEQEELKRKKMKKIGKR